MKDINELRFGNQPADLQELASRPNDRLRTWFIEKGIASYIIKGAPTNDSDITKQELQSMTSVMKSVTPDDISFAREVEQSWEQAFIDFFTAKGVVETMGEIKRVDNQTEPLLFYLKDVINRPRPYQLAYYREVPLYPSLHSDANSASYPSGHALSAHVIAEYFSRKYPEYRPELSVLAERIAQSRVQMGWHYPSDGAISKKISEIIWKNNLIE